MTPLIDVMLVLLVIFIITAPLMASSSRARPAEDRRRQAHRRAAVRHAWSSTGRARLFLDDKPVTPAQLAERLARGRRAQPATPRCSCAPTRPCPTAGWPR